MTHRGLGRRLQGAVNRAGRQYERLFLLLGLLTLSPALALAQGGSLFSGGITVFGPTGRPLAGATVTICAFGATGIPCSPTVTVYNSPSLSVPVSNPQTSDGLGNVFVYAAPGNYTYTVTGPGVTGTVFTATSTLAGGGGGDALLSGNNVFTGTNQFNDVKSCGPSPWVDVRCFNVRSTDPNVAPQTVGITANITISTTTATISAASTLQNNDGVVIYGAGAPHSLTTPGAPTVIPSLAQVGTGTGFVATGLTGATTYDYKIVARTKASGLTVAGATGTTTTGAAALGSQSVALTSCSRSNDVVTCVTSSAHGLAVGAMVYLTQTLDGSFGGWFRVDTTTDNTHFTFSSGNDTRTGATLATTGGTAFWFNANHLTWSQVTNAWEYYICGRATGSFAVIGVSRPQGSVITDLTWDDFGATMMGGIVLPPFVASACSGAATSDHLVTTIVSGAGTTTLTLTNAAGTTVSGATIRFDAAPNILTAANAVNSTGGTLYFPISSGSYVVNSFLILPKMSVVQEGGIYLNETMQIGGGGTQWRGNLLPQPGATAQSFGFETGIPIVVNSANPGIFVDVNSQNSSVYSGLNISGTVNGLLWVSDKGSNTTWENVSFSTSSSNSDYMGMALLIRGQTADNPFDIHLKRVLFIGGPAQTNGISATPLFFCSYCGATKIDSINFSRRGMLFAPGAAGGDLHIRSGRAQGGIMPMLMVSSQPTGIVGGVFSVDDYELDTMAHALVANLPQGSGSGAFGLSIRGGIPTPSADGVSNPGMVTGRTFNYISTDNLVFGFSGQNRHVYNVPVSGTALDGVFSTAIGTSSTYSLSRNASAIVASPSYPFFTDQVALAAPTCPVSAGGSVPVATETYRVVPVWWNGAEGTQSLPCTATTTGGNQTVTLTWTAAPGNPKGYNVRRSNQTWPLGASNCSTIPQYTGLTAVLTAGFSCGTAPTLPAGGPSVVNSSGLIGPQLLLGPTVFANLGTPANGIFLYCPDCTIANPCVGAGTGAFAKRLNGVWVCN